MTLVLERTKTTKESISLSKDECKTVTLHYVKELFQQLLTDFIQTLDIGTDNYSTTIDTNNNLCISTTYNDETDTWVDYTVAAGLPMYLVSLKQLYSILEST